MAAGGRDGAAAASLERAARDLEDGLGAGHALVGDALVALGELHERAARWADAEACRSSSCHEATKNVDSDGSLVSKGNRRIAVGSANCA